MKYFSFKYSPVFLFVFCLLIEQSNYAINPSLCEVIKQARELKQLHFKPGDWDKIKTNTLPQLDEAYHLKFFEEEKTDVEKNYLFGRFSISKDRLGLVCFNKTVECDHDFYFFSLHVIDSCADVKDYITLSLSDDDGGILYDISSSLSKTFDTLTIKKETTSEWVVGTDSKTDTLFTDIYKISLKSRNLDTISSISYFNQISYN